jgi:rubrerythrin
MGFNPLDEKGILLEKQGHSWSELNIEPYKSDEIHPYTRTRVILMNGAEVEAAFFLHQFARHEENTEIKRKLALARRMEQQQQKRVNWLIPAAESVLEVTIGYEQVAVDLTAWLARTEPDEHVKQALDFALLEDFDHLYRYANLLEMDKGIKAEKLVGELTEIMPGRPTIAEHRHPLDGIREPIDKEKADILTKLHVMTIVAAEQQTMNFYMNVGNRYPSKLGRGLYLEIAQIEEQHVTHYESLADPTMTWLERWLMHDYNEAYLYYSCMETESDPRLKKLWEHMLEMEIGHLHADDKLLQEYEGRKAADLLPPEFPELVVFQSNKEYVREIIEEQVTWTTKGAGYVPVDELPEDHRFYSYQNTVNSSGVPSHDVIEERIKKSKQDYRLQTEGDHPIDELQPRDSVSADVAR